MRRKGGQKVWTASMIAKVADIAVEKGVSIRLLPDGTIDISPGGATAPVASARPDGKIWTHEDPNCPPFPISPRFDRREEAVMEQLAARRAGKQIDPTGLKHYGPSVQIKLLKRGYIDIVPGSRQPDELQNVFLTEKGMKAWRDMVAFNKKYVSL